MRNTHPGLFLAQTIFKKIPEWLNIDNDYSYILNIPKDKKTKMGFLPKEIIVYSNGMISIDNNNGVKKEYASTNKTAIEDVKQHLKKDKSYFCMGSLDINRKFRDTELPLLLFIQPSVEIHVDHTKEDIFDIITEDSVLKANVENNIHHFLKEYAEEGIEDLPIKKKQGDPQELKWEGEGDQSFLNRIKDAIEVLQKNPSKMVATRTYEKPVSHELNAYELYQTYSSLEANCAASHFIQLPNNITSLGCSPENLFEVKNQQLNIDVVAATRAVVSDPDKDARYLNELKTDPKEQLEFEMTVERYREGVEPFCEKNSIEVDDRHVKNMRNVRHLHTTISAKLREEYDQFELFSQRYPSLDAHKKELIPLADRMQTPTRFYGGIIGYLSESQRETACFQNLRTALIKDKKLHIGGGVGIMPQSRPELELLEVKNKLRCLMESVSRWESGNTV